MAWSATNCLCTPSEQGIAVPNMTSGEIAQLVESISDEAR